MKRIIKNKIQLKENTRKIYITSKIEELNTDDLKYYVDEFVIDDENYEEDVEQLFGNINYNLDTNKKYEQKDGEVEESIKPNGLWYSYDYSWLYFLLQNNYINEKGLSKMDANSESVFNVNAITIAEIPRNLNILSLKEEYDVINFSREYNTEKAKEKNPNKYNNVVHNWKRVSEEYDGIEILEPVIRNREIFLCNFFDVPSGCIWRGLNKIKIIKTIPLVQFIKENKVFSDDSWD